jgi:hypothetical protein
LNIKPDSEKRCDCRQLLFNHPDKYPNYLLEFKLYHSNCITVDLREYERIIHISGSLTTIKDDSGRYLADLIAKPAKKSAGPPCCHLKVQCHKCGTWYYYDYHKRRLRPYSEDKLKAAG